MDATDRADVAGNESCGLLGAPRDDHHVRGQAGEAVAREVGGAAGDIHAAVGARGSGCGLAALGEGLVRDAARVDDGDICGVGRLDVAAGEQVLTELVHVRVRDLAAEEIDREARHSRDATSAAGLT